MGLAGKYFLKEIIKSPRKNLNAYTEFKLLDKDGALIPLDNYLVPGTEETVRLITDPNIKIDNKGSYEQFLTKINTLTEEEYSCKNSFTKKTTRKIKSIVSKVETSKNLDFGQSKIPQMMARDIEKQRLTQNIAPRSSKQTKKKINNKLIIQQQDTDTDSNTGNELVGGAKSGKGIPKDIETIYYVLWNPDKTEPERCIEKYDATRLEKDIIMPKLTTDEIQGLIEKYIGKTGIINFLIEKEKETWNKGENSELNNLFTYIKGEMKELSEKIEKEKGSFTEETSKDGDICSEFFKDGDVKVLETIRRYLTPKKEAQDLFGEVFTPLELVCEMLSKLPSEVWTKKDYKWLDPANGIGNFPVVVYYKLMKTLTSVPEKERSIHIINNMLYMNELNKVNVAVCRRIFKMIDPNPKATPNFLATNFLTQFMVGTGKGGGVIWKDFVFDSVKQLKEGGYLIFVHPTGWRKLAGERASAGDVWQQFKNLNLVFVKISDKKIKHFPTVDYYVLQNTSIQHDTHVISEFENKIFDGKINLYNKDFIPHFISKEVWSILDKVFKKGGEKFDIVRNQSFKPTK